MCDTCEQPIKTLVTTYRYSPIHLRIHNWLTVARTTTPPPVAGSRGRASPSACKGREWFDSGIASLQQRPTAGHGALRNNLAHTVLDAGGRPLHFHARRRVLARPPPTPTTHRTLFFVGAGFSSRESSHTHSFLSELRPSSGLARKTQFAL
ncbi:unnamed protein product [Gadus morhua 'NCC']